MSVLKICSPKLYGSWSQNKNAVGDSPLNDVQSSSQDLKKIKTKHFHCNPKYLCQNVLTDDGLYHLT